MKIFRIVLSILVIIILALGGTLGYIVRSPQPQTAGSIQIEGLQNSVEVIRDQMGIPHIYADSAHDLFMAQGFIHAQDRFWQMEFWRRIGSGRLSEIFGASSLDTDRFTRTLGWARVAAEEEKALDADTRFLMQSYADGVNAYIESNENLGLEFTVLAINGARFKPEKWTIINTLTWAKAMSWDLGGNMANELSRALIMQKVGAEMTSQLRPLYPDNHPIIVPKPASASLSDAATELLADINALNNLTGGGFEGIGSNNWVISGKLTDTGKPYLADDPHLGIQMPSIWYEVGLHCRALTTVCPYDVVGFSFAGAPGVVIGHNNRIAWGVTNLGPDVQDLFVENINPANPNQYEVNGAWQEAKVINEVITVKGKVEPDPKRPNLIVTYNEGTNTSAIAVKVRITRHGPIINEINDNAAALKGNYGEAAIPASSALALRWTALEPSFTFRSVLKIDRAQNFQQFREALKDWQVPSQNFVYADVDGNIGYQAPGNIPIRAKGDGLLPVPGWSSDYEWKGYIPFEELPYSYNPPQGYIATANNAVVGSDYKYMITLDWDKGYRARRIVDMIEADKKKGKITLAAIQKQQGDNANLSAQEVMPFLANLTFTDSRLKAPQQYLLKWDFQQTMDSGEAALYNMFWSKLIINTFYDELPDTLWPGPSADTMMAMRYLLEQPNNKWWDDTKTKDRVETRDEILAKSFKDAYDEMVNRYTEDTKNWAWGKLHTASFQNATLGKSGIAPIEWLFNRNNYQTAGGASIVNATGYRISKPSDKRTDAKTFEVTAVPSMRMIVDLADFKKSVTIHTTGQSGHAFSKHYNDMIDLWRTIQYHPMLWDRGSVEAAKEAVLILEPKK